MTFKLSLLEIIGRLLLAIVVSAVIGYDREHKNRPAGMKTHVLVCLGACIMALVQKEIGFDALNTALQYPKLTGVMRADDARLIAQVVSGIGFLGAGTIMVQHRTVRGLTTAASLWAVAGLGLAIGMGDYEIAVASAVAVILVLVFLKRIVHVKAMKRIEIQYHHRVETKQFIQDYFETHHIEVNDVNFRVTQDDHQAIYVNIYEISLPKDLNLPEIIEDLSLNKNVMRIQTVSL
ncbi:MgtC/SapB family protein [Lacticaseibacillus manihotivorans]|jgi:putative Mg2+ transporter-C (MgtC) family protein|uniref:Membrane protein, mgtc sapb family n=2 Tax=Lacticaseibacillus manihotivorans TaxID=88233 RepID=A0A0R1QSG9_9LACO|nr:MgtC/SapB family protein [Lacticaseibacillus manihotivorans]KRL44147.1 membrane protein, mgtc sapb family [Lacticaseibacillus manihotivorans DSM 13343 = JCM 12514]QFQ90004.1 MgtC/SapB family protein [Lacticaseibacillus manihotivorans]